MASARSKIIPELNNGHLILIGNSGGEKMATIGKKLMALAVAAALGGLASSAVAGGFAIGTQSGSGWEETPTNRNKELWDSLCAQPMCAEFATVELNRLHHYCAEGHTHDAEWRIEHIRVCDRHKRRGDCGLNDADRNYSVAALRLPDGSWRPVEATPSESTEGYMNPDPFAEDVFARQQPPTEDS